MVEKLGLRELHHVSRLARVARSNVALGLPIWLE